MCFAIDLQKGLAFRKNFIVYSKTNLYKKRATAHECFQIDEFSKTIYFPFGSHHDYIDFFPNGDSCDYPKLNGEVKFTGQLYTTESDPDKRNRDQDKVVNEALKLLEENGTVFLSLFTGFGKTMIAIYLSLKLGLKIAILCHLDEVKIQWVSSFKKFTGNTIKIQLVEGEELDETADVYILGVIKASLMIRDDFMNIGTIIVDEAHLMTEKCFTLSILNFPVRYCIGLSATPDRKDGLEKMFDFYFGDRKDFIIREERKKFTVYKYMTGITPSIDYVERNGKTTLNWPHLIKSVEENPETWKLIESIVLNPEHSEEKIIILCDRNALAFGVYDLLKDKRVTSLLTGKRIVKHDNYDVLIAGFKKGGVGFDDPRLTMSIIASDTSDVRQYDGRVRKTDNIIYHLVHNHNRFHEHYKKCEKSYIKKGGTIIQIGKEEPKRSRKKKKTYTESFL